MKIQESGENYLETILLLQKKCGTVRSVDIVAELKYSKSSVSRAVGILKKAGFITVDKDGVIGFTEEGRARVDRLYERHLVLTRFLESLGVDGETAEDDACRIEHFISDKVYEAIKNRLGEEVGHM